MAESLAAYVSVKGRFHRSVNLPRDAGTAGSLQQYMLTPTIRELAIRIVTEASDKEGNRCWSITGPFGSGKSAFGLFLVDLLSKARPEHSDGRQMRKSLGLGRKPHFPVLALGSRGPIAPQLADAFRQASVTQAKKRHSRRVPQPVGYTLADHMVELADQRYALGDAGLVVVIDELGKFLEFASMHPDNADVFLLQQLAEAAVRSRVPIIFVTILHSAFADYLPAGDEVRRAEWQKVQGRFADVPYQLPSDQMLQLVGAAIEVTVPPDVAAQWGAESLAASAIPGLSDATVASLRAAEAAFPIHPVTALLLWPLFRSKGAQNERSLFAFLVGHDPFSFSHFLNNSRALDADLYRVPRLYDYILAALGQGAFRGEQARRWALIDQATQRIPVDAPPLALDVVKSIGLLDMLGGQVGLRADAATLSAALGAAEVGEVCAYLQARSLIVFRRHVGAFALWQGSDFDLEAAHAVARVRVTAGRSLSERLRAIFPPRPWVARRHYIETGTLRYFDVSYRDLNEASIRDAMDQSTDADGKVVFLFASEGALDLDLTGMLQRETRTADGKPVVLAVPRDHLSLAAEVLDYDAWDWVARHSPELEGDTVARQEVSSRQVDARRRLAVRLGGIIGLAGSAFTPSACDWWASGSLHTHLTSRDFQGWLSSIADAAYRAAPLFKNELLNRSALSSSASAARRNLISRMLSHQGVPRLGIEGFPPEASMYEALLAEGRFHRSRSKGRVSFGRPSGTWQAAWDALNSLLEAGGTGRVSVQEIFASLSRPPLGLREGPLPVLLCAFLLGCGAELALYEDGVLVPELRIEVFERLMRNPAAFEVRSHRLPPEYRKALRGLETLTSSAQIVGFLRTSDPGLLAVVRSLVTFAARLPPFTRQTRRMVAPEAAVVRDQLMAATDPVRLLFEDLPKALNLDDLRGENLRVFVDRLTQSLHGLSQSYPRLLDEVETSVHAALGLSASEHGRRQLSQRASLLLPFIAEPRLQLFVREAASDHVGRDWRESIARAINGGLPASHWKDADIVGFQLKLRDITSDFLRVEELSAEQRRHGAPQVLRIGMLDATGAELRRVFPIHDDFDAEVSSLIDAVTRAFAEHADGSTDHKMSQLEALGRVAVDILRELSVEVPADG
jgi:hypothetical protein